MKLLYVTYIHHFQNCWKLIYDYYDSEKKLIDRNFNFYLNKSKLIVYKMNRGCAWLDSGTSSNLHEASVYVSVIERRQGVKIGCPEEAAYRSRLISKAKFKQILDSMPECEYKGQLKNV